MNYGWKGAIQEFLQLQYQPFEQALMIFVYGSSNIEECEEDIGVSGHFEV